MNSFVSIKAAITVRQVAEHYGVQVSRNGMVCFLFHDDLHHSIKLNIECFYCFCCGTAGDVIELVAREFDPSRYEAAQKLAVDFGMTRTSLGNHSNAQTKASTVQSTPVEQHRITKAG